MIKEQDVLDTLKSIIDPDFKKDIVSLGFIKNLTINEGHVAFDIALTTPACPIKDEFERQALAQVKALPGVVDVQIKMTAQSAPQTKQNPTQQNTLNNIRSIIAISSCKGGVGKSTVAAHLAQELAGRGFRVGLVDADIHGPSIPSLFGLHQAPVYVDDQQRLQPVEQGKLKIMSFGFLLGDGPAVMRGPMVSQYVQQVIFQTHWGELDYLFIDMPPGTGDVQLTITQNVQLDGAVIITTPQTLSLIDVARGILMFEKVNVPILGIIENMAYFQCGKCDTEHAIFGRSSKDMLQERFGVETLAQFPLLPSMGQSLTSPEATPYIAQAVDKTVRALGKASISTTQTPLIYNDDKTITLTWPDQEKYTISNHALRLSCRCAICADEYTGKVRITDTDIPNDIAPTKITPLGNYAIGVAWNDGHTSGIYPYTRIKELCSQTTNA